jgi:hypothetical protein
MLFAIPLLLFTGACGRTPVDLPPLQPTEPATITAAAPGFDGKVTIDGLIASIPKLRALIEPPMRAAMAETMVAAEADAKARGVPDAGGYFFNAEWTGAAASSRYLDVVGRISTFSGGAHPMTNYDAYVWDRLSERRLRLADLMGPHASDPAAVAALANAARDAVIAVKRARSPDYSADQDFFIGTGPDGIFAADVAKFGRNVVIAAPDASGAGGGLTFIFAPYDVGPYSDGKYEVTVPAAIAAPFLSDDIAALITLPPAMP